MLQRVPGPLMVLAIAGALASCATLEREEVAAPAQGGAVAMRTNTALVVSLPPDPATGYGWVLRSASPNLALVGGPDYTPAPKPPGLVGVADTTAFRFRALAVGDGALEFAWVAPPGQPPVTPERVVRYDVKVGPGLPLATDVFGTVGMQSARPAGNSTMGAAAPVVASGPAAPTGYVAPASPVASAPVGSTAPAPAMAPVVPAPAASPTGRQMPPGQAGAAVSPGPAPAGGNTPSAVKYWSF